MLTERLLNGYWCALTSPDLPADAALPFRYRSKNSRQAVLIVSAQRSGAIEPVGACHRTAACSQTSVRLTGDYWIMRWACEKLL